MNEVKKVLFLGGSITAGALASSYDRSWAYLCYQGISQPLFGGNSVMYNASISGTGSFLAAMRLSQHVLPYSPDVVFIEFSVNDLHAEETPDMIISSLDYIIQTLIKVNPQVAITFVYTTDSGKNVSATHSVIAKHYGIPEIDIQTAVAEDIASGGYGWDQYLTDGVYPNDLGHRFYADFVVSTILSNSERFLTTTRYAPSIATYHFHEPRIELVTDRVEGTGFTYGPVQDVPGLKHMQELMITHALTASTPGATLKVQFNGTHFGLYHCIFLDCGCASVWIDGEYKGTVDCYYNSDPTICPTGEYVSFFKCNNLSSGMHTAEIKVLEEKNKASTGHRISLAGFMVG